MNNKNNLEFEYIIADLMSNKTVQEMSKYRQHYDTSCLEHCKNVAFYNYIICKKLKLNYISAARAGLLHDLFLYDWRVKQPGSNRLHAFHHPRIALNNSLKLFNLNKLEQDIILKHMWPLTVILPKYPESYITTLIDKYCALSESYNYYKKILISKELYRYAYAFLSLMVINI